MDNRSKKEWEAKIIAHAWKDPSFKKQLLSNPKAALKQFNCPCPAECNVKIIEEHENTWTIVLPANPSEIHPLSQKEVANAAGGTGSETTAQSCHPHSCTDSTYSYESCLAKK